MKKLLLLFISVCYMVLTAQAATLTYSVANLPQQWAEMVVKADGAVVTSGTEVAAGTQVVFTAAEGTGFRILRLCPLGRRCDYPYFINP
ncbi:MAG: hypothetical protein IJV06_12605 [Bacteroidaceae bacterium]|nr:hypothetical protein [Bacteroidaceae bacterium]MBQ9642371.1 hypothetical protein [Bacteroidaceae bacterium]